MVLAGYLIILRIFYSLCVIMVILVIFLLLF